MMKNGSPVFVLLGIVCHVSFGRSSVFRCAAQRPPSSGRRSAKSLEDLVRMTWAASNRADYVELNNIVDTS